ncbi:hypothetical protein [Microbacterium sp. 1P06AB]|uniref:hypothetical protein n=1 Tax=Microbacterium sp. 1P06AB TaxID=3132289 RepID=UPI0039A6A19D
MAELVLSPNPDVWSVVPPIDHRGEAEVVAWVQQIVDEAPPHRRSAAVSAATLALRERAGDSPSTVLLLTASAYEVIASLSLYAFDDVPPAQDADEAARVAERLIGGEWGLAAVDVALAGASGWRFTSLEAAPAQEGDVVSTGLTGVTLYVLECRGRCVIALLPPLHPTVAAVAHLHAEQVLGTLDIVVEAADA